MQTANDAFDLLSVQEQLEHLKSGVQSAASAEKALLKAKAERLSVLRREAQKHEESDAEKMTIRIYALTDAYKERVTQAEAKTEARNAWIQQAYHNSKSSLAQRIQQTKDSKIGRVQGTIMRNRQVREKELKQATERHQELQQLLKADRATRRDMRKSILATFRTFRPWLLSWFEQSQKKAVLDDTFESPEKAREALLSCLEQIKTDGETAGRMALVRFFRFIPLAVIASVIAIMHVWYGLRAGGGGLPAMIPSLCIAEGVLFAIWLVAFVSSFSIMRRVSVLFGKAILLESASEKQSAERLGKFSAEVQSVQAEEGRELSETFRLSDDEWRNLMSEGQQKLDERFERIPDRLNRLRKRNFAKLAAIHDSEISGIREQAMTRDRGFEVSQNMLKKSIDSETDVSLENIAKSWKKEFSPVFSGFSSAEHQSKELFPPWTTEVCSTWEPPAAAPLAVRLGEIKINLEELSGGLPGDPRFAIEGKEHITVPFALGFPDQASMLIESDGSDSGAATRALAAIALRLLAAHPPGRSSFLFIDPVGLGKDFAGLMHLADYEETLITNRIWTQSTHIEERLAEVNDHIEKVIQMYLRDEFVNITEYNKQAGTIAEKYRFIVIAGFPAAFSDTASKRLRSIASSGARCGVHLLMQRDLLLSAPDPALDDELRRVSIRLAFKGGGLRLIGAPHGADEVILDLPPSHQDSITLVHRIGRASVDSNRVQVPFAQIAPSENEIWKFITSDELRVPIGRTGAKKLQMLAIGKGTRQHMLVAGKTGSGKSTLFHVIITNLALWCSPNEVEFYLVDFKKGVEFKCYATKHLPHARVVAIESDREFALSVLQRVDAELKRRGELFRRAGAQDVAGYKRSGGKEIMPRTLLLIDEFQEFFTEDDAVAQEASLLLDRIVRQGRAFGIHVILGSQTLGGAYTLARATLGQMVIRVALQCNETDAHLIMDDDNPAPRLLTRPGEGIYNDQAGALAANSPFQIVWLPEDERDDILDKVSALAAKTKNMPPPPIIFEGNAPADVRDNLELAGLLGSRPVERPRSSRAWLGAPNSIKGPTEAIFQRQSGSHLLVIGQSAERSLTVLAMNVISIAAQYPPDQVKFFVLDPHAAEPGGADLFHQLAKILPCQIRVGGPHEVGELMTELGDDLTARIPTSGRDAAEIFLLVHDLQRFKALRPEDDFKFSLDDDASASASPSKVFADLLGEGGPCGMHVVASTDTWNNVSRWVPRKLMAEFEMRVLFQMSANDSANLIDSPAATTLGLHRALFFNEHLGTLETFRPYALPDSVWLEEIAVNYAKI